jgi:hypothetical protein
MTIVLKKLDRSADHLWNGFVDQRPIVATSRPIPVKRDGQLYRGPLTFIDRLLNNFALSFACLALR